jgi:sulfur-carrier protein
MARVLYFGRLADVAGCASETCALPGHINDTATLRRWLDTRGNLGGALLDVRVRLAINNQIAVEPLPVSDTDEIAFLPPIGGG